MEGPKDQPIAKYFKRSIKMWLQALHFIFLFLQVMVGWKFLIIGLEVKPDVALKLGLTDADRKIYPYLTVWNLVFHIIYVGICVSEDFVRANSGPNKLSVFKMNLQKYRSLMFESIVFPGSLVVCAAYWTLMLMDPLYLFPGPIEDLVPAWINFFIHSGVGIFAIGELMLRSPIPFSSPSKHHVGIGIGVMLLYGVTTCFHYFSTKKWIYPFLELLSWPQRLCVFILVILTGVFFCVLGSFIRGILFGTTAKKTKRSSRKTQRKKTK
ncbi:hypothetical protein J437_LFUL018593 [Ladona fulva]|uniref:Uncharacterized protein n=1 Tax=Ladona fulva TaxID=123851 RepID=A0A8K0KPY3_LADFU|nr:hypothetical protein J437_LFUL018593 [Ladona fulva]